MSNRKERNLIRLPKVSLLIYHRPERNGNHGDGLGPLHSYSYSCFFFSPLLLFSLLSLHSPFSFPLTSLSLSVYVSLFLSLSLCLSLFVSLPLSVFFSLSLCLPLCLSLPYYLIFIYILSKCPTAELHAHAQVHF